MSFLQYEEIVVRLQRGPSSVSMEEKICYALRVLLSNAQLEGVLAANESFERSAALQTVVRGVLDGDEVMSK